MTLTQYHKETMYNVIITKFVNFLADFSEAGDFATLAPDEDENSENSILYREMKCLEFSVYLMMQILNKVVSEHKYPFRKYMNNLSIIIKVAKLVNLNSNLINIEIVKFYKALLRSKDQMYI